MDNYESTGCFSPRTLRVIEDSGIPYKFWNVTLRKADAELPIVKSLRDYVTHFLDTQEGMIFMGPTGAGKTHYACAVANEVLRVWRFDTDVHVVFFNTNVQLHQVLDSRYFRRYDPYNTHIQKLERCDLLIVDDLLHVSSTDWAKDVLYRIYEARYQNGLRTITTLNANIETGDDGILDWSPISTIFNDPFMRRVVDSASDNIFLL